MYVKEMQSLPLVLLRTCVSVSLELPNPPSKFACSSSGGARLFSSSRSLAASCRETNQLQLASAYKDAAEIDKKTKVESQSHVAEITLFVQAAI